VVNADPWRIFLKIKEHQVLIRVHLGKNKKKAEATSPPPPPKKKPPTNPPKQKTVSFLGFSTNQIFINSNIKESIFQLPKSIIQIYTIFYLGSN